MRRSTGRMCEVCKGQTLLPELSAPTNCRELERLGQSLDVPRLSPATPCFTVLDLPHITPSYGGLTLSANRRGGAHATGSGWLGARARGETWAAFRPGCLRPRARLLRGVETRRARGGNRRCDGSRRGGVSLGASAVTLRTVSRHRFGHGSRPGRSRVDVLAHPLVFRSFSDGQRG